MTLSEVGYPKGKDKGISSPTFICPRAKPTRVPRKEPLVWRGEYGEYKVPQFTPSSPQWTPWHR